MCFRGGNVAAEGNNVAFELDSKNRDLDVLGGHPDRKNCTYMGK